MTKIDFTKNYRIEPIPSKENEDLAKMGVSSFPGTTRTYGVSFDSTLNKYLGTGLDLNDPYIMKLVPEEKKKAQEYIKGLKQDLEDSIGVPNFLDVNSDNWCSEICRVEVETGQDLKIRVNGKTTNTLEPSTSYRDKISLLILFNSKDFPTSKLDINKPEFRNAKFYLTTDSEVNTITKDSQTVKRKANKYLYDLFNGEDVDYIRAWEVAFFLDLTRKLKPSAETLDEILQKSLENDPKNEAAKALIKAMEMPITEIEAQNTIKKASILQIIKYNGDFYHRGTMNFRKTLAETADYLLLAENAAEYAEIMAATEKKLKGRTAL